MATGSDKNVNINVNATDKTRRGLTSAQRNLRKTSKEADNMAGRFRSLARATVILEGPLGGTAGRVSALATLMGSVNASAVVAGAGIASLTAVAYQSLTAFAEYEQQLFGINQLLQQTGNASGLTAEQIDAMAVEIGAATLESTSGVREAATTLLTFKSVAGEAFERTLNVAADLAATTNTDLRGAIIALGKALEDPATSLGALRRSGVSFTNEQKEMIIAMQKTGDAAKAQAEILNLLEGQMGGAARAKGQGLAGAIDLVTENWNRMLETLAVGGAGQAATDVANGIAMAIASITDEIQKPNTERLREIAVELNQIMTLRDQAQGNWLAEGLNELTNNTEERIRLLKDERIAILEKMQDQKLARIEAELDSVFAQEAIAEETKAEEKLEQQKKATAIADKERKRATQEAAKFSEKLIADEIAFEMSLLSKGAREDIYLEDRLAKLDMFYEEGLIKRQLYDEAEAAAFALHNSRMTTIHEEELKKQSENAVKLKQMEMAATRDALYDISTLMSTQSRALFNVGKTAATAAALINTYQAVTKTMAATPYPWNIPLAAAQAVAGMAQVAKIRGTKMSAARQTGGVVLAGRQYLVGERGPELFTANASGNIINNNRTGGAVTNNINVTVVNESGEDMIRRHQSVIWNGILQRMNEEGMRFA